MVSSTRASRGGQRFAGATGGPGWTRNQSAYIAGRKISTLQVDGYTDSIGSKQYNLPLSERRAQNCLNYFGNLSTLSDPISNAWGYENSMESNLNESGRMKNRRVEITIILVNDKITTDHILELKLFTEDKEAEIFSINSSTRDTITINTKDGIVLRIPPQAFSCRPTLEQLEGRWVPTAVAPGNITSISGDTEFMDTSAPYVITQNLNIPIGVTLTVGSGVSA